MSLGRAGEASDSEKETIRELHVCGLLGPLQALPT